MVLGRVSVMYSSLCHVCKPTDHCMVLATMVQGAGSYADQWVTRVTTCLCGQLQELSFQLEFLLGDANVQSPPSEPTDISAVQIQLYLFG